MWRLKFLFLHTPLEEYQVMLDWNKPDYLKIKTLLTLDWESLLPHKTTQEAFDLLTTEKNKAIEECVPTRVTNSTSKCFKPLWMNKAALKKAKKKYHAWIRYLNTKAGQNYLNYIAA